MMHRRKAVRLLAVTAFASVTLLGAFADTQAQQTRTTHIIDGIYLITGTGGNVTVSVGSDGVMVVDTGTAEMSHALLAAIKEISDATIRYIINTSAAPDHVGGNPVVRRAGDTFTGGNATVVAGVDEGAAVVAHENALHHLVTRPGVSIETWPTETFYVDKHDLYFNGEPIEIVYQPAAVDDTNLIVHFRRSDVVSTGDVLRLDSYPIIDLDKGGSINGVLDSLNALVELAIPDTLAEGGTLLIPGHGRISDEGDLVRYRDMLTIIRDRVQNLIDEGETLIEIQAARPSFEYDSRYGATTGAWTTAMFIEAVYGSLAREAAD